MKQQTEAKQFQNRVLLVGDNISGISKEYYDQYCHYAILLIGEPTAWRKHQYIMVESEKKEPCTIIDRSQPCIVYATKEDLEKNEGVYWPDIPEQEQEILYEYTAKII